MMENNTAMNDGYKESETAQETKQEEGEQGTTGTCGLLSTA